MGADLTSLIFAAEVCPNAGQCHIESVLAKESYSWRYFSENPHVSARAIFTCTERGYVLKDDGPSLRLNSMSDIGLILTDVLGLSRFCATALTLAEVYASSAVYLLSDDDSIAYQHYIEHLLGKAGGWRDFQRYIESKLIEVTKAGAVAKPRRGGLNGVFKLSPTSLNPI